jgi:Popeye protein conserved region
MFESLYPGGLVHIGAILYLVCFAFRNQIWLRSFAIAGDLFYTAYYFLAASKPLWDAILWNIPAVAINVFMIYLILQDNKLPPMEEHELLLFRKLARLTPGQFKKLLKGTTWQKSAEPVILTEEGKKPDKLFFVLKGDVSMEKSGARRAIPSSTFIGEVAYLQEGVASATVNVAGESVIAKWPHDFLKKLLEKDEALKSAFTSMMASDLASKLNER